MSNAESPANPVPLNEGEHWPQHKDGTPMNINGLTKREYFAAMAMQGLLAADVNYVVTEDRTALFAVQHADALLAQLEETQS